VDSKQFEMFNLQAVLHSEMLAAHSAVKTVAVVAAGCRVLAAQ